MNRTVPITLFLLTNLVGIAPLHAHIYLFSHGFGDTYRQAYKYMKQYTWLGKTVRNKNYILGTPIKLFNYPDAIYKGMPKLTQVNLGQKGDVDALKKAYDEIQDESIVLFGTSRGASTVVNFAGIHDTYKLKAIIAECPFDHIDNVFNTHWFVMASSWLVSKPHLYDFFLWITQYKKDGEHPINHVGNIDPNLPIMFICTKSDTIVPYNSTLNLYKKIIASGHKHAYIVHFERGRHSDLIRGKDAQKLRNIVHAFYAKYDLPHNQLFAQAGKWTLEHECQPTLESLI